MCKKNIATGEIFALNLDDSISDNVSDLNDELSLINNNDVKSTKGKKRNASVTKKSQTSTAALCADDGEQEFDLNFTDEKLISAISEQPHIFNFKLKPNRDQTQAAWTTVINEIYTGNEGNKHLFLQLIEKTIYTLNFILDLSEKAFQVIMQKAKNRWKNIRTAFEQYRGQLRKKKVSGAAATAVKEYKYAKLLGFLKDLDLQDKATKTSVENDQSFESPEKKSRFRKCRSQ